MRKSAKLVTSASVLALLIIAFAPTVSASTLTVDLNPTTGAASMTSVSVTNVVLTYPVNSTLSRYLDGYADNTSYSSSFAAGSQGVTSFRNQFQDGGEPITINNMSVTASYVANANATALVIKKQTTISATVTGVFTVVNGTVTANLGWRSFRVVGALNLSFQGKVVDVNLLGDSVTTAIYGRSSGLNFVVAAFGGASFWNTPTLNFSALSVPLNNWTKNYDSVSNTTTFSKTISGNSSLSSTYTNNGQTYSLKVTSDPSAQIVTKGYAEVSPSGNSLTIAPTPTYLAPATWVEAGVVGVVGILAAALIVRSRRRAAGMGGISASAAVKGQ